MQVAKGNSNDTEKLPFYGIVNKDNNTTLSCEILPGYKAFCRDKVQNQTKCHCIKPEESVKPQNFNMAYTQNEKLCLERSNTYQIKYESDPLLVPRYLQNLNDKTCVNETFGTDDTQEIDLKIAGQNCQPRKIIINNSRALPTLYRMIKELSNKFGIPMPNIIILNGDDCPPRENHDASIPRFLFFYLGIIEIPFHYLSYSDNEQFVVYAHEFMHLLQFKYTNIWFNNIYLNDKSLKLPDSIKTRFYSIATDQLIEAEADLASGLVTNSPCLAFVLKKNEDDDRKREGKEPIKISQLPIFNEDSSLTRKLLETNLTTYHPSIYSRISYIITMFKALSERNRYKEISKQTEC